LGVVFLKVTAGRVGIEGTLTPLGEIGERVQQRLHVLDLAHRALVGVHAFEVREREARGERVDDFRHIAELFEGQPQTMDRPGLARIDHGQGLRRPSIRTVHGLKQLCRETLGGGATIQGFADLSQALSQLRQAKSASLRARYSQEACFPLQ